MDACVEWDGDAIKGGEGGHPWGPVAVVLRQIVEMPHFCTIPIVEKEIIHLNHQPHRRDNFYCFFKQANGTMATSLPLIIGDSLWFLPQKRDER
jgi:hypothetical protein